MAGPHVVSVTMPLTRVYEVFNLLGTRHIAVVDRLQQLVGVTALRAHTVPISPIALAHSSPLDPQLT